MLGETLWAFGMADFKELEKLVAAIQKQLAPDSEVQHNVKLDGRRSGVKRQIDVLVSQRVGQYDIRIIIDCKDHKTPIDVKGVEEFYGLFCDVDAHKGVLVCPAGFTKAAKNLAQDKLLDLYSPVDTGLHKWRAKPAIPAICDFREAAIGFGVQMSAPYPFRMQADFFSANVVYDATGNELGTAAATAFKRWNAGEYPIEPGEHESVPIFHVPEVHTDNGYGQRVPVTLTVNLVVARHLYFGHFPITRMSGFKDEIKGGVIANAFEVGLLDPETIARKWTKIDTAEVAPIQPVLQMVGLYGWPE
jgi:hypothetical protein